MCGEGAGGLEQATEKSLIPTAEELSEVPTVPSRPELIGNYPNPFNPSTTIRFGLPLKSQVTLTVFNTLGEQVAQLVNGEMEAGYHEVKFDGTGLSSGVYFYRIQAGRLRVNEENVDSEVKLEDVLSVKARAAMFGLFCKCLVLLFDLPWRVLHITAVSPADILIPSFEKNTGRRPVTSMDEMFGVLIVHAIRVCR